MASQEGPYFIYWLNLPHGWNRCVVVAARCGEEGIVFLLVLIQ